jgi:hypothetical protein
MAVAKSHGSTYPSAQVAMVQVPFVQLVVATFRELSAVHVTPQPPQSLVPSAGWASQPSLGSLLQFWYLGGSGQQEWQGAVTMSKFKKGIFVTQAACDLETCNGIRGGCNHPTGPDRCKSFRSMCHSFRGWQLLDSILSVQPHNQ